MKPRSNYKIPKLALGASVVVLVAASFFIYHLSYAEEILPRVSIGPISVGGKTASLVADEIDKKIDEALNNGFVFVYNNTSVVINPIVRAPQDPELAYTLISFDTEKMAQDAFKIGHEENLLVNLGKSAKTLLAGNRLPIQYTINREGLLHTLKTSFGSFESPAENATLAYEQGALRVTKEKSGNRLTYEEALDQLENQIQNLKFAPISLALVEDTPTITQEAGKKTLAVAQQVLTQAPLTLQYEKRLWVVDAKTLGDWLTLEQKNNEVAAALDARKVTSYLESIAEEIYVPEQNAKFKMENGRVIEFQDSKNGKKLDLETTLALISKTILEDKQNTVTLVVDVTEPIVTTANVNNLGIQTLIGKATTSFAGSPKNRRYNIKVGVSKLHGLLIAPAEEFSLLRALGEISAATGFREELVIKGDKTIPEFGGGLCQIATTMFRTVLNTGLPVTERQNHSYRVPYYEPPIGKDATIYDPAPDLKFINDTPGYILIQGYVEGDTMTFEFWGTPDGRVIEQTEPVVTNRVPPPPKKEIETEGLKPGERKCTERAHEGADAKFTYKVTYLDGKILEKEFRSHYRPWAEVCLVGKKKEAATSTPSIAP